MPGREVGKKNTVVHTEDTTTPDVSTGVTITVEGLSTIEDASAMPTGTDVTSISLDGGADVSVTTSADCDKVVIVAEGY